MKHKPGDLSKRVRHDIGVEADEDELTPQSLHELSLPDAAGAANAPPLTRQRSSQTPPFSAAQPLPQNSSSQDSAPNVASPPRLTRSHSRSDNESPPHPMWQYGEPISPPSPASAISPGIAVSITTRHSFIVYEQILQLYRDGQLHQTRLLRSRFNSWLCYDARNHSILVRGYHDEQCKKLNGESDIFKLKDWLAS